MSDETQPLPGGEPIHDDPLKREEWANGVEEAKAREFERESIRNRTTPKIEAETHYGQATQAAVKALPMTTCESGTYPRDEPDLLARLEALERRVLELERDREQRETAIMERVERGG